MGCDEDLLYNAEQIQPCIAPLIIYPSRLNARADDWKCGGTCFFVKSGAITFLITAAHVYKEVEQCGIEFYPLLMPVNGAGPVDISKWKVISKSDIIDIAVVEVPSDFHLSSIGKEALTYTASPGTRATLNEPIFFIGYPGQHRTGDSASLITRIAFGMDSVTSVSDCTFLMSDDSRERRSSLLDPDVGELNFFGGLSGSPMLVVRDGNFHLVGVFIEGGFQDEGIHSPFKGAHFDFINPDGTIDELRVPY